MPGPTTVSNLDSIIQVIVADTQLTARQQTIMPNLVRRIDLPEHKGNPIDRPKMGKLVAEALTEGLDMPKTQTLTDTDVSIEPTEVGLQSILTDRMISRAPGGFQEMASEEHRRAYAEKLDKDLLGLFSGLSNGLSSAGNSLTLGNVGAGHSRIVAASEPGPPPHFYVLHPYHAWDVHSAILPLIKSGGTDPAVGALATAVSLSDNVLTGGVVGQLFGVPVMQSGLIDIDSDDDAYSAIFSKDAFMLVVTDPGSMRPQRDESLRATELNYVGEYGFGEWVDSYGYFFLADAEAPTA